MAFSRGRNATLLLNVNAANVSVKVKNFRVQEQASTGADSVCGEDRDRPFIETNSYKVTFSAYQSDAVLIAAWFLQTAAGDAQVAPIKCTCGVTYNYRNGTKQSYMLTQCTREPLDVNAESRAGALMFDSGFNCRYMKPTQ